MEKYRDFLPELKSMTLFQNIKDEELIPLLEVMGPEIVHREASKHWPVPIGLEQDVFFVVFKGKPLNQP
jgi:hypothetical protein